MCSQYRRATVADAIAYAHTIVDGEILSGKLTIQACQRFIDDLQTAEGRGLFFDVDAAQHALDWYEFIPHVKGRLAGQPIELAPWQAFIISNVFGWKILNERGELVRRFRTAYVEVARKNSKSTLSSGIGLYMAGADGEGGAEVYSAATTRDQARIVFDDAAMMVKKSPVLKRLFGVHKLNIHQIESGSKFEPLSADANTLDGLNVHCGIIDELHAHKTREVYDVIETATGSREQPLLFCITTAGFNKAGICYEVREYGTKVISGAVNDDSFFCIIYTLDDGDNWDDEANWIKANPHYGLSVKPDDIRRLAKKAREMPTARNNFLTKRLNIWCNAETAWLDMNAWEQCPTIAPLDDRLLSPTWLGVDLANKKDIAGAIAVFKINDAVHISCKFWYPEDRLQHIGRTRAEMFRAWAADGYIKLTAGNVIDHDVIANDIAEWVDGFTLREICFDPWGGVQFAKRMQDDLGFPMVEVQQSVKNLSEAMKTVEALMLSGKLAHENNPVMNWMMSNVVAKEDANENIFPRKSTPENKIDGAVALFTAMNRVIFDGSADSGYHSDPVPAFLLE